MQNSGMTEQSTMGIQSARKLKESIFEKEFSSLYFCMCYSTMSKLLLSVVRDTGNNLSVH